MSEHRRKICIVVNSRANYGRIKSVMQAVVDHPDLELQLVVGASALLYRFGAAVDVIRADGFTPDATVYSIVEGENPTTMAKSTGLAIIELTTLFENLKPDIVLTVADRFETLATAVSASYMNLCLAHTQGGEVTGSIDESVRHAVTKLSHIHFPATEAAAKRLIRMGENSEMVYLTGCPSIDVIGNQDLSLSRNFFKKHGGVGASIDVDKPYLLVIQHPVTTEYGDGFKQINHTLEAVANLNMQAIWLWPNVDAGSDDISKGLRMFRERAGADLKIHFYRNLPPEDFARCMKHAACVIGNSSSPLREGAYLGVPAVNIGTRQSGREHGPNITHVDHDAGEIRDRVLKQIEHGPFETSTLFGDGTAGKQIADILANCEVTIQKRLCY